MPTGRIPYAARPINTTAYDRTLLQMMQRQSEQDQQYRREERQRQQEQWGHLASLPARLYETYRGIKDQQLADQRAKAQAQAAQDRLKYDLYQDQPLSDLLQLEGITPTSVESTTITGDESYTPAFHTIAAARARSEADQQPASSLLEMMQRDEERLLPVSVAAPRPAPGTTDPTMMLRSGFVDASGKELPGIRVPIRTLGAKQAMEREAAEAADARAIELKKATAGIETPLEAKERLLRGLEIEEAQRSLGDPIAIGGLLWKRDEDGDLVPAMNPETGEQFKADEITPYQEAMIGLRKEEIDATQARLNQPGQVSYSGISGLISPSIVRSFESLSEGKTPEMTAAQVALMLAQFRVPPGMVIADAYAQFVTNEVEKKGRAWDETEEGGARLEAHSARGRTLNRYTYPPDKVAAWKQEVEASTPMSLFTTGVALPKPNITEPEIPPTPEEQELIELTDQTEAFLGMDSREAIAAIRDDSDYRNRLFNNPELGPEKLSDLAKTLEDDLKANPAYWTPRRRRGAGGGWTNAGREALAALTSWRPIQKAVSGAGKRLKYELVMPVPETR
jgi:hypothetical protein